MTKTKQSNDRVPRGAASATHTKSALREDTITDGGFASPVRSTGELSVPVYRGEALATKLARVLEGIPDHERYLAEAVKGNARYADLIATATRLRYCGESRGLMGADETAAILNRGAEALETFLPPRPPPVPPGDVMVAQDSSYASACAQIGIWPDDLRNLGTRMQAAPVPYGYLSIDEAANCIRYADAILAFVYSEVSFAGRMQDVRNGAISEFTTVQSSLQEEHHSTGMCRNGGKFGTCAMSRLSGGKLGQRGHEFDVAINDAARVHQVDEHAIHVEIAGAGGGPDKDAATNRKALATLSGKLGANPNDHVVMAAKAVLERITMVTDIHDAAIQGFRNRLDEWDETQHPRESDGKWTDGTGSAPSKSPETVKSGGAGTSTKVEDLANKLLKSGMAKDRAKAMKAAAKLVNQPWFSIDKGPKMESSSLRSGSVVTEADDVLARFQEAACGGKKKKAVMEGATKKAKDPPVDGSAGEEDAETKEEEDKELGEAAKVLKRFGKTMKVMEANLPAPQQGRDVAAKAQEPLDRDDDGEEDPTDNEQNEHLTRFTDIGKRKLCDGLREQQCCDSCAQGGTCDKKKTADKQQGSGQVQGVPPRGDGGRLIRYGAPPAMSTG